MRYKKPSSCCATLSRCKFWVDVSRFSPCVIYLSGDSSRKAQCYLSDTKTKIEWRSLIKTAIVRSHRSFYYFVSLSHSFCISSFVSGLGIEPIKLIF